MRTLNGVEIFSAGEWNGDRYTTEDLDAMVAAFHDESTKYRPSVKLGHDPKQKLLQEDGYPAAGWIGNLYRIGEKLIADFIDMPEKIYDLVAKKAYRKVSAEIYWDININGTVYPRLLSAVALLGGDMPAVNNLNDLLALYGLAKGDKIKSYARIEDGFILKTYDIEQENEPMAKTENEIKLELEVAAQAQKLAEQEAAVKKFSASAADAEKELATLKQFKVDAEKNAAELAAKAAQAELDGAITKLEAAHKISPSMKEFVLALCGAEKKEYSIGKKNYSKIQLIDELLKLHTANGDVNFVENSTDVELKDKNKVVGREAELDAKISEYAKTHKCSYSAAYKAVMKTVVKKDDAKVLIVSEDC